MPSSSSILLQMSGFHSLLRLNNILSSKYTMFSLPIHGYLGWFHILAMGIMLQYTCECRYLFDMLILFSFDRYPEIIQLDHIAHIFLAFWAMSILLFIMAILIYIYTSSAWVLFLHILARIYFCSFDNSHSDWGETIYYWGLDMHFTDV
jgi:hypothetical protein